MESVAACNVNAGRGWAKTVFAVALGMLLCCSAYLCFLAMKKPLAPPIIVVSDCKLPSVGMQRIQVADDFTFLATHSTLICKGQMDDTPPFTQRFCLKTENSKSVLTISLHDAEGFRGSPVDPMLVFSEYSERRHVVDATGRVIGEDDWGYLEPEKRWRKIHLEGVIAKYGPVTKSEAQNYDRILSSVCFSTP